MHRQKCFYGKICKKFMLLRKSHNFCAKMLLMINGYKYHQWLKNAEEEQNALFLIYEEYNNKPLPFGIFKRFFCI